MSNCRERVVVTDLGAVTQLGGDVAFTWASIWQVNRGPRPSTIQLFP